MIAQATERRLAGDWQGACAASNVDVDFGLTAVAEQHGAKTATRLDEDLRHFAPDLLRWHLPRCVYGRTTLLPGRCVILASYGARPAEGPYLCATTLDMVDGPQRLTLRFGEIGEQYPRQYGKLQDWRLARHLWDSRHSAELLARCGGGNRAPFFSADGTPRAAAELPAHEPGADDPVGRSEWATLLFERGDTRQAFEATGITLDDSPSNDRYPQRLRDALASQALALTRLEPEIRLLDAAGFGSRFQVPYGVGAIVFELRPHRKFGKGLIHIGPAYGGLCVRMGTRDDARSVPSLPEPCCRRLPDLDLLRFGDITPGELHPLVSASLFPARTPQPTDGPPGPQPLAAVPVRCRGEWHKVRSGDGRLRIPHTAEEERRERAMRAFGGPVTGCFAAAQAWTSGTGWLPKALRQQRQEFFSLVQHGDTAGVLRLLDAGVDPHIRDGRQRTLLHVLHLLDHEVMLPRLLDAGVDVEARDHHGRTPLHVAVGEGPVALVRALLKAGARTDAVDDQDDSLSSLILRHRRKELSFLYTAMVRDHPNLTIRYPPPWEDVDD